MALYYFRNTGDSNFGTASNWSLSDGGPADGAVPTSNDDAWFTSNSGNCVVAANYNVYRLNTTTFNGTITINSGAVFGIRLTTSLSATTTITGAGTFYIVNTTGGTFNVADNGATLSCSNFTVNVSSTTVTLTKTGNWTFSLVTITAGVTFTLNNNSGTFSSTNWTFNGSTTMSNIDFSTASNVTFGNNNILTVNGNLNISGTYTLTGTTGGIRKQTSGTLTTGGKVWSAYFGFIGTNTTTLTDDLNVSGIFVFQISGGVTHTINGNNIYHTGTFGTHTNGGQVAGTTKYYFQGTTTGWNMSTSAVAINIDFYIDCGVGNALQLAGSLTTGNFNFSGNKEFKILSGTLTTSSLTAIAFTGRTIDLAGQSINGLALRDSSTYTNTLLSDIIITGTVYIPFATATTHTWNGSNLRVRGTISNTSSILTAIVTGTTKLIIDGTGNQSWSNSTTSYQLRLPVDIDKSSGTLTITGTLNYNTGIFTYTTGTVDTTGSTLTISTTTTLNTGTVAWNNVTISITATTAVTLSSNFNITGTLTLQASTTNVTLSFPGGGTLNPSGAMIVNNNFAVAFVFTINIPNNLSVTNLTVATLTTAGSTNATLNGNTINVSGNLTIGTTNPLLFCSGTTTIVMTGTGTITQSGTGSDSSGGYLRNNLTFNTSGTINFNVAGNLIKYNTGTITYISGEINTSGTLLTTQGGGVATTTFNTNGMAWFNMVLINTINVTSDLHILGYLDCRGVFNGANIYVYGNDFVTPTTASRSNFRMTFNISGTATFVLAGSNMIFVDTTNGANTFSANLTINVAGSLIFGNLTYPNFTYQTGTLRYISGTLIFASKSSTFNLNTATLINCHKINFNRIVVTSGAILTMNEFFNGSASVKTIISASSTTNYSITFQDGFEKIAKFINISGATITNPNQLLVFTNSKRSFTNTGIRYINTSPNGIPKGDPSIQNTLTPRLDTFLVSDPVFN